MQTIDISQATLIDLHEFAARSQRPFSLLDWKGERPELSAVPDDIWLFYASAQLRKRGHRIDYIGDDDPFAINSPFHDIEVSPQ